MSFGVQRQVPQTIRLGYDGGNLVLQGNPDCGALKGGLFSEVSEYVASRGLEIIVKGAGVPDEFIPQDSQAAQRTCCGLDTDSICAALAGLFNEI